MKRDVRVVVAGALVLGSASCALVSGLSSLDVEDGTDASVPDVLAIDVAPKPDVATDGGVDVSPPLDGGVDVFVDAPKDAVIDTGPPSIQIQCGASTCPLTSTCCHNVFGNTFTCFADASACSGTSNYPVTCDVRSCPSNQVCCVTVTQGLGLGAACAASCGLPNTRLCAQDGAPCGNGLTCGPSVYTFPPYDICK